jgi:hypothetical protein
MRTVEDRLLDRIEAVETQNLAARQRRELGWSGSERIDPLAIQSVQELWTVRGRSAVRVYFPKGDTLRVRPGHTTLEGLGLVVRINELIRRKALFGDGHARFVVAKEIGHATLRHPDMKAALLEKHRKRVIAGSDEARRTLISAACSMEFHASVFAAKLLIGQNGDPNACPEDLSIRCGIDAFSAQVFFSEVPAKLTDRPVRSG